MQLTVPSQNFSSSQSYGPFYTLWSTSEPGYMNAKSPNFLSFQLVPSLHTWFMILLQSQLTNLPVKGNSALCVSNAGCSDFPQRPHQHKHGNESLLGVISNIFHLVYHVNIIIVCFYLLIFMCDYLSVNSFCYSCSTFRTTLAHLSCQFHLLVLCLYLLFPILMIFKG